MQERSGNGSQLWEFLMTLKMQNDGRTLNPLSIKNLTLAKDRENILNTGGQRSQLFLTNKSANIEYSQQIG